MDYKIKSIVTKIVSLVLLSSITQILSAQEAGKTLQMSVQEAEQYATDHNRSLQNATLDVKKAKAARWQSIANMLPQISTSFDYNNYCGYTMEMGIMNIEMNPAGTFGISAGMAVSGAQIVGATLSKISLDMAKISVNKTEQQIRSQVRTIYLSILAMTQTMSLLDSSLTNLLQLQQITENTFQAGAIEQTDVDQLSIQVASMRNTINSSARSLEMLYNSLRLLLGVDVNAVIVLTDKMESILNIQSCENLLNNNFNINNNYDYQLLEKNKLLAKRQITLAAMNFTPTLTAFYQFSEKTYFGKDAGFDMTPPNLIGFSIKLPLFSSGLYGSQISAAKIDYHKMQNTIADTKEALLVQDKQLRYNLRSALEDYSTQKENIDVSKRVFESIGKKYEHGTASSLDLTNASTSLITAQTNYLQSVIALVKAQVELENLLNN